MSSSPPDLDVRRDLDPEQLLTSARAESGLSDLGDEEFVEPMTHLLEAAASEARLNLQGVAACKLSIHSALVNRLRLHRDLAEHPEIRDEDVSSPVVIVGLPRTGTTKLHRMLSAAPDVQQLLLWRLLNPAPFPGSQPGQPDPRIVVAQAYEQIMWDSAPDLMAGHPMAADQPDEETLIMETNFESVLLAIRLRVPSYLSWVRERSPQPTYDYLRVQLQYLQWQDGGGRGRPWIMKAPLHLGNLDTLLATFPNATVVHCHRDPAVSIPSMARLTESYRRTQCDVLDLSEIGSTQLQIWSEQLSKNLLVRDQLGADILDVQYSDIVEDPLAVIADVFRRTGRTLTPEVEAKMTEAGMVRPKHPVGRHEYSLDRYGLTKQDIETRFASYIARFVRDG